MNSSLLSTSEPGDTLRSTGVSTSVNHVFIIVFFCCFMVCLSKKYSVCSIQSPTMTGITGIYRHITLHTCMCALIYPRLYIENHTSTYIHLMLLRFTCSKNLHHSNKNITVVGGFYEIPFSKVVSRTYIYIQYIYIYIYTYIHNI